MPIEEEEEVLRKVVLRIPAPFWLNTDKAASSETSIRHPMKRNMAYGSDVFIAKLSASSVA